MADGDSSNCQSCHVIALESADGRVLLGRAPRGVGPEREAEAAVIAVGDGSGLRASSQVVLVFQHR